MVCCSVLLADVVPQCSSLPPGSWFACFLLEFKPIRPFSYSLHILLAPGSWIHCFLAGSEPLSSSLNVLLATGNCYITPIVSIPALGSLVSFRNPSPSGPLPYSLNILLATCTCKKAFLLSASNVPLGSNVSFRDQSRFLIP